MGNHREYDIERHLALTACGNSARSTVKQEYSSSTTGSDELPDKTSLHFKTPSPLNFEDRPSRSQVFVDEDSYQKWYRNPNHPGPTEFHLWRFYMNPHKVRRGSLTSLEPCGGSYHSPSESSDASSRSRYPSSLSPIDRYPYSTTDLLLREPRTAALRKYDVKFFAQGPRDLSAQPHSVPRTRTPCNSYLTPWSGPKLIDRSIVKADHLRIRPA